MSLPPVAADERTVRYHVRTALYTQNGMYRIQRHWQYIQTPLEENSNHMSVALTCIAVGAFGGAVVGAKVGEQVEQIICQKPNSGTTGKVIGGGTGFVVGGALGGYFYMTMAESHPHFDTWKKACISGVLRRELTSQYADEALLQHFVCPVELCVMDLPIHTPSGVFYDASFITKANKDAEGNIQDPLGNPSFSMNKADADYERSIVIHKRSRYLIQQDLEKVRENPLLAGALRSKLVEIERTVVERYETRRLEFEEARINKTFNTARYREEIGNFEGLFGDSPESDLDWSKNWPVILNQRWAHFHPDDKVLA